jgi:hypothetical protein
MRPSSRKPSSNRHTEERPARPARSRPNRESMDRAWESGAQRQHADYRPRSSNGPSPRWHKNQQSEHSSSNNRGSNRPYGNRQDQGSQSRSFDAGRRTSDDQRFRDRRDYADERNGTDTRRSSRYGAAPRSRDGQFRDQDQRHSDYRERSSEYRGRSPRNTDRDTHRSSRSEQPERFPREGRPRNEQGPRRQNRPPTQRADTSGSRYREQFEGDYEHFNDDTSYRSEHSEGRTPPNKKGERHETPERHVTRLPDGRVLKGPRPAQRKNAQFWTEVAEDTEDLLDNIHPSSTEKEDKAGRPENDRTAETAPKKKSRRATPGAVSHEKESGTTRKPRTADSKPSRRSSK